MADRAEVVCPQEHTINKDDNGRYWITCGSHVFAEATFDARRNGPSDVDAWTRRAVDGHLIDYLRGEIEGLRAALNEVYSLPSQTDVTRHIIERDLRPE